MGTLTAAGLERRATSGWTWCVIGAAALAHVVRGALRAEAARERSRDHTVTGRPVGRPRVPDHVTDRVTDRVTGRVPDHVTDRVRGIAGADAAPGHACRPVGGPRSSRWAAFPAPTGPRLAATHAAPVTALALQRKPIATNRPVHRLPVTAGPVTHLADRFGPA